MNARTAGSLLIAAASLFWFAWLLMPGVGVTDAGEIFALVGSQRGLVLASVLVQLGSAVLYVPALISLVSEHQLAALRGVKIAATLLAIGALGSAADAVLHLLAYAMTARGIDTRAMTPVMKFMQGPGLWLLAPLLIGFFAGGPWLSVALSRAGIASQRSLTLHWTSLVVLVIGGPLAAQGFVPARLAGWLFLGCVSAAQAWVGAELYRSDAGARAHRLRGERALS